MLASNPDTLSASMLRTIQRHREIFQDSSRELRRTKVCYYYPLTLKCSTLHKANVHTALDKANLLSGVRNDIECVEFDTMRMHNDVQFSAYKSSAADSLLAERGRIDNSHRMTDDILA